MSARLPSNSIPARRWLTAAVALAAVACDGGAELPARDLGPCGRGMARSCQCEDGSNGIAQCKRGSDWGECVCNPEIFDVADDASIDVPNDAGRERIPRAVDPALADCESTFAFRAHAAGDFAAPYGVAARGLLPASERQRACFYFRVPYAANAVALGFSSLLSETPGLRGWSLYGLDKSTREGGEVGPCSGNEPGAYLLAGFAPGVADVRLPHDVGLALPYGAEARLMLEVEYENDGAIALLDRTGIRICTARGSSRAHTAAVHLTGSEGICIPPGARGFEVRGTCMPRDELGVIHIVDVWPAMHQHGRRMAITIQRANGTRELLHDEPFHFEEQARFPALDVKLSPGDTLETRCFYDNDGALPIPFGDSPSEETCLGFITAWPAGALSSEPLGALGGALGIASDKSCREPASILASCNGAVDRL